MNAWFDSLEGLRDRLTSVESLLEVVDFRHKAHERGERLQGFVVAGRWILWEKGDFGRLVDRVELPDLPLVVSVRALTELGRGGLSWVSRRPESGQCAACEAPWTLATCHDQHRQMTTLPRRGTDGPTIGENLVLHGACLGAIRGEEAREYFRAIFNEAGYPAHTPLREIPNGYWKTEASGPWFVASTRLGPVSIGWRKRVISIEWTAQSGLDARVLFEKEDVTKETGLVHAWGRDKAVEYLTRLRQASLDARST